MNQGFPSIEDLIKARKKLATTASDDVVVDEEKEQAVDLNESDKVQVEGDEVDIAREKGIEPEMPKEVQKPVVAIGKTESALQSKIVEIEKKSLEARLAQEAALKGFEFIKLKGFPISPDALRAMSEEQAKELKAIVFFHNGPEMRIGATNPEDEKVEHLRFQLAERHKTNAVIYQISEESFEDAVKLYETLPKIKEVVKGVQIKAEELDGYQQQMQDFSDIDKVLDGANITDILAILVAAALKLGSSDIHIEAEEKGIVVRFRVDGVLQEVATLDKQDWKKIINRIKLIASLKINIVDKPQDGRFTIFQKDTKIDVRTSTIPTAWGESVVMRILNPGSIQLEFEQLGFRAAALKRLLPEIEKPNGMIVTTGPTGSGKTTTLYSILRKLNTADVKIITLEDPVEYKLEGINQSQIDHSKSYTFSDGLRSILRQDPDIVMVGEIRDLETADAAIQAALTGHLLLSTIHTNDAAGAVPRFLSMGVKPFLLAPAISVVMGQRLLRRLCGECKVQDDGIAPEVMEKVEKKLSEISQASGEVVPSERKFWKAVGCEKCHGTGYKGRVGVYEILVKNAKIEEFILSGEVSEYKMREVAMEQGMVDMAQDGILKALEGLTSISEIQRSVGL
jgi:type II secretory ATPase GspE/PulE/Tfp pilus assembly ATPase PilB-like protein